jgi:hypothetical protein
MPKCWNAWCTFDVPSNLGDIEYRVTALFFFEFRSSLAKTRAVCVAAEERARKREKPMCAMIKVYDAP